jgi:chemotaxis protein MotB
VLFDSGKAEITPSGRIALDRLASAIIRVSEEISKEISKEEEKSGSEIAWVLQVDGHTDSRPISNSRFPGNLELSSARALSVVNYLIEKEVPKERLVAAGHGENAPLPLEPEEDGDSEDVLKRNRRIEIKVTSRH